ncbi:MAG: hypothetical protein GXP26_09215 [Planctomycetes bacterium]|nr:hypothetical protein [Planctomycetota bacterium]
MNRICRLALPQLSLLAACLIVSPLSAGAPQAEQDKDGVTITIDGKMFTRYLYKSGAKPILWPIVGPTGKEMTRGYPMRDVIASEKKDHIHHRSFWFTHGDVNGISFWHEQGENGNIVQRDINVEQDDQGVVISTTNDWMGPKGKKQCEDARVLRFRSDEKQRWIDVELTVTASAGPVEFGDTKEGCFGVRVAGTMRTEQKGGGKITNSEGQTNVAAWGKPAAWVDYTGPVDGETVGIAIFNHPSSFRFPSYWHVRTYGLFTANPFGLHDFKGEEFDSSYSMKPGESFTLRYRVLFHSGDTKQAHIAEEYEKYATKKAE